MNVRSHAFPRALAMTLAGAALATPTAGARPAAPDRTPAPDAPVVQRIDEGFDWGSAAIGAGSAGVLIVLVSVGGVGYRNRRDRIGVAR